MVPKDCYIPSNDCIVIDVPFSNNLNYSFLHFLVFCLKRKQDLLQQTSSSLQYE